MQATNGMGDVSSSPHEFRPFRKFRDQGRCAHCMLHESLHPVDYWAEARALHDKRPARQRSEYNAAWTYAPRAGTPNNEGRALTIC